MTQELNQVKALVYAGGCFGDIQSWLRFSTLGFVLKTKLLVHKAQQLYKQETVQREEVTVPSPRAVSYAAVLEAPTTATHFDQTEHAVIHEIVQENERPQAGGCCAKFNKPWSDSSHTAT